MVRWRFSPTVTVSVLAAIILAGCSTADDSAAGEQSTTSTPAETTARKAISAHELLFPDGAKTSTGPALMAPPGDTYFTRADPPDCAAAVLLKGSPLAPPGAQDHADAAYTIGATSRYTESINLYDKDLDPHQLVMDGFGAVSNCRKAVGVASDGHRTSLRLSQVAVAADGVLEWAMLSSDWNCHYAWAVIPQATLLLSTCDSDSEPAMAEWASTRLDQMQSTIG